MCNANSIKTKRVTSRSSEAVIFMRGCATENILYRRNMCTYYIQSETEFFSVEEISALVYML